MIFAIDFAKIIEIKNAIIPEIIIVKKINNKFGNVKDGIKLFTATAAPVLVF